MKITKSSRRSHELAGKEHKAIVIVLLLFSLFSSGAHEATGQGNTVQTRGRDQENTRFFHTMTTYRFRKNKIKFLKHVEE
jgi:hypothetical protein